MSAENEIRFVMGHLNGWPEETIQALGSMGVLASLPEAEASDALGALYAFAQRWGASNFLAKKIAYVVATSETDVATDATFERIAEYLEQNSYSAPYFSAIECVDSNFPYFSGMKGRIQLYRKYVSDDFRQLTPLHNILASPVSAGDVAAFLRKSHSMSLIDQVASILQVLHLRAYWPSLATLVFSSATPEIASALKKACSFSFNACSLYRDTPPAEADLAFYRRSMAFVEFREPAIYRASVDRIVGRRLLPEWVDDSGPYFDLPTPTIQDLTKALHGFRNPTDYRSFQKAGTFLRTVHFLHLIEISPFSRFNYQQIRYIFENTAALDSLMTEQELERLYATADTSSRSLISVLALALHKSRSQDDDVDFKFRFNLGDTINQHYRGDVVAFINSLLISTPEIANFLLSTLDRHTLQKLYWIIESADEADRIRQEILRSVGQAKQAINYFVEADQIEAQRQVSKLRQYFDDSRVYVDGSAMKKWLQENPSSYSQQYVRHIEHGAEPNVLRIFSGGVELSKIGEVLSEIQVNSTYDYILVEAAKIAFNEFCKNAQFGIESYLGRRIRHNTLAGMMRDAVESVREKPSYSVMRFNSDFEAAYRDWLAEYQSGIEYIRKDLLQFRSQAKSKGLFSTDIRDDLSPASNLSQLRRLSAAARSGEIFNELTLRYCWAEIRPQLEAAARELTVNELNKANDSIERHLGRFNEQPFRQYRTELRSAVHDVYMKLGSWFREPESGFVAASTQQLGDLILLEASNSRIEKGFQIEWGGSFAGLELDGPSVHRLYDCLSVLIRNAARYRRSDTPISITVDGVVVEQQKIGRLTVSVCSELPADERELHLRRLRDCLEADDVGGFMIREGFSGIKKLRFITTTSELTSTVSHKVDGDKLTISFALTVEIANNAP
ncbi:hypothetical protein N7E70_025215 [Aminobacter sp. NyZ550]|uniref:hypothetical protein n=1 Tax=Aminobacter sp. NyZ550 TaxID=2979870 RepID=UPI0021D5B695|nr:hypothetical protein [Aminobacter sp. NyZ550]WAX94914.1 hypothetical protein N7E70_025215 [Aminobacter sp. NyZ550]